MAMKGSRPGKIPARSVKAEQGRLCTAPGCQTQLSVYNQAETCWQHMEVQFPTHRGKRLTPRKSPVKRASA